MLACTVRPLLLLTCSRLSRDAAHQLPGSYLPYAQGAVIAHGHGPAPQGIHCQRVQHAARQGVARVQGAGSRWAGADHPAQRAVRRRL
jgi:hypothetical protein